MFSTQRKALSQNFCRTRNVAHAIVGTLTCAHYPLILEIGAGTGRITQEVLPRTDRVVAIEIDPVLVRTLLKTLGAHPQLDLHQADILHYPLPTIPYTVVGNLPFAIEGTIVRRLLEAPYPPQELVLVVMHAYGKRLCTPNTLFSVQYAPWFDLRVTATLPARSFIPVPSVDAVIVHGIQKKAPLLPLASQRQWRAFVERSFQDGKPVYRTLSARYGKTRVEPLFARLSLKRTTTPRHVPLAAFLRLFISLENSGSRQL